MGVSLFGGLKILLQDHLKSVSGRYGEGFGTHLYPGAVRLGDFSFAVDLHNAGELLRGIVESKTSLEPHLHGDGCAL